MGGNTTHYNLPWFSLHYDDVRRNIQVSLLPLSDHKNEHNFVHFRGSESNYCTNIFSCLVVHVLAPGTSLSKCLNYNKKNNILQ